MPSSCGLPELESSNGENSKEDRDKKRFWHKLLCKIRAGILSTLVLNCVYLISIYIIFNATNSDNASIHLESGFRGICSEQAAMWLFLNLIALFVLICIQILPESQMYAMNLSAMDLWEKTGYLILMVRILHIAVSILKTKILRTQACYVMNASFDDGSFLFPFISILIDVSQIMILPYAMFPYPWYPCSIYYLVNLLFAY